MIYGLVPARAGSKSVVGKNLRLVGNRTLLDRAVTSALDSDCFDAVVVSSDDDRTLSEALKLGAHALKRPKELSSDTSTAYEVVAHFILSFDLQDEDLIVYLQPTSPFRHATHISQCVKTGLTPQVAITNVSHHPKKTLVLGATQLLRSPEWMTSEPTANRQSLAPSFAANGALYFFSVRDFRLNLDVPVIGARAFLMDKVSSLDIDDEDDLRMADAIAKEFGL